PLLVRVSTYLKHKSERGELEIGQLLHFKTESRNFKMDGSNLRFRLSVLKCRSRPISNFPLFIQSARHSYRSARMGSTFDARCAGIKPAQMATRARRIAAPISTPGSYPLIS